jgi:hypothetical protein
MNGHSNAPKRRSSWPAVLVILALIFAALIAFLFWRVESWPMRTAREGTAEFERLGRMARDAFAELGALQPRVTINNRVYLEQTNTVAELAVLSRQVEVEHEFTHTWAGSTKRIKLHGTFAVKAGFNLRDNLTVDIRNDAVAVQLPHATILSVEQQKVDVLEFQNGYWNRISPAELEKEFAQLPKLARERAQESDLLAEAEATLRKQLEQRLGTERPVVLMFAPTAAPQM